MQPPEILQAVVPTYSFWHGKKDLASAVTNGLLGSGYLMIFWAPLIIGLALPLETAMIKQAVCWGSIENNVDVPGINLLPPNVGINEEVANDLVYDNSTMYSINRVAIIGFVLFACFFVSLCFYLGYTVIRIAGLDFYEVMIFNFVMAVIISIIEAIFFIFVAMKYNPYNVNKIYQKTIIPVTSVLQHYIDISSDKVYPIIPSIPKVN